MPGRRPEHARRLFEAGGTPAAVEAFLDRGAASPLLLRRRLHEAIEGLSP
jgi:hypothetical protein